MKYKHPQMKHFANAEIDKAYRGDAPKVNPKAIIKTKDGARLMDANKVSKKIMLLMIKRSSTIITRMSDSIANLTDANLLLSQEIVTVEKKFDNTEKTLTELIKEWKKVTKMWGGKERDYLKELKRLGGRN